jgi:type IV pilus assembly protein PilC
MIVTAIVTTCLIVFLVPQFEKMYANFGATLPLATQLVIGLSHILKKYLWLMALIGFTITISIINLFKKSPNLQHLASKLLLKTPIFGNIILKSSIAKFTKTLSITFASGLPLIDALKFAAASTNNVVISAAILQACDKLTKGQDLKQSLASTNIFPNMPIQMIGIGETSGKLDLMLTKISDYYEEEVDVFLNGLSTSIEPIIISLLGLIIGGIVVTMYFPIFKMGNII